MMRIFSHPPQVKVYQFFGFDPCLGSVNIDALRHLLVLGNRLFDISKVALARLIIFDAEDVIVVPKRLTAFRVWGQYLWPEEGDPGRHSWRGQSTEYRRRNIYCGLRPGLLFISLTWQSH